MYELVNLAEALITLNGKEAFVPFIEDHNALVKHYNTITHEYCGRIHSRKDIAEASIQAIDEHLCII